VSFSRQTAPFFTLTTVTERTLDEHASVLDHTNQGIMPTLYTTLRLLKAFRGAEEGVTYFSSPDWSGVSAYFGTSIVHVAHIKHMVETLCAEVESELDQLTFNNPVYTIDWTKPIYDEPRSVASGFSFIDDKRNQWVDVPPLLQYMLNTPAIASTYVTLVTTPDGPKLKKNMYQFQVLRKLIYELQKKIAVLVMLTYGAPARGTELASHVLRNVPGGSIRNFFHNFGTTFLRGSYNKTTSLTGLDQTMARAPLPRVSRVFIWFTVFIRPLYLSIQDVLGYKFLSMDYSKLFMGLSTPIESCDLGLMLEKTCKRLLNIPITMSWYRQYMAYISTHHEEKFPLKAVNTSVGEQLGHSAGVDRQHYGLDRNLPPNTDYQGLRKSILTSGVFHQLFGLGTEIIDTVQRITHGLDGLASQPAIVSRSTHGQLSEQTMSTLSLAVSRNLMPTVINSIQRCVQQSHASVVHLFAPNKVTAETTYGGNSTCIQVSPRLIDHLRHFFNAPGSTMGFTDHNQAQAVQIAAHGKDSLLLVTATGSGKTLPGFMASRYFDLSTAVTVYIVPYNAMHGQYLKRLEEAGLSHSTWHQGITPENAPQNIIVTCDSSIMSPFVDFIRELTACKRLARVIFDEAHLIIRQDNFRPVMQKLRFLSQIGVQIILLTATLPVALQPKLLEYVGLTAPIVLRGSTPRPNISYRILRVKDAGEVIPKVAQVFSSLKNAPDTKRILIFCSTINQTQLLARKLDIEPCFAGLGSPAIEDLLSRFRRGEIQALATTCVLGVGLHVSGVTHVIHAGNPRDIIEFAQDTGRAGRDKEDKKAWSVVVSQPLTTRTPEGGDPAALAMELYLENRKVCRRVCLQEPLDGSALPCTMLGPEVHLCDICAQASTAIQQPSSLIAPSRLPTAPPGPPVKDIPNLGPQQHIASTHAALQQSKSQSTLDLYRFLHQILSGTFLQRCPLCLLKRKNAHDHAFFDSHPDQLVIFQQTKLTIQHNLAPGTCNTCLLPQHEVRL
jgi:hypothetical protein